MSPLQRTELLRLLEERDADGTTQFNRLKKPAKAPSWSHFKNLTGAWSGWRASVTARCGWTALPQAKINDYFAGLCDGPDRAQGPSRLPVGLHGPQFDHRPSGVHNRILAAWVHMDRHGIRPHTEPEFLFLPLLAQVHHMHIGIAFDLDQYVVLLGVRPHPEAGDRWVFLRVERLGAVLRQLQVTQIDR